MSGPAGAPVSLTERPDLDRWLPSPALVVSSRGSSPAPAEVLWQAARTVRLADAGLLGRLIRWRIPGTEAALAFDELFRRPPFAVLEEGELGLTSGLTGRIWTLSRDYARLEDPKEFLSWSTPGTARVLFASWVERTAQHGSVLHNEARVEAIGRQGRLGLAAVRPLVRAFDHLIESEGIAAAIRLAGADGAIRGDS